MQLTANVRPQKGFTLIEILIVIAILALLAAIAIPNYAEYTRKARRSDAQNTLMTLSNNLEKYYSDNNTYVTDATAMGYATSPIISPEGHYSVAITAGGDGIGVSYVATATPVAGSPQATDTDCATITYNSTGLKGSTPAGNDCWH